MGLPAIDYRRTTTTTRRTQRGSSSSRSTATSSKRPKSRKDSSRAAFSAACVVLLALAIFGLGRVALTVQATEASYEASQLREDIKAERLAGQLLEVDKSALTTPSRIEAIAGSSMKMADADSVCYLSLPDNAVVCEPVPDASPTNAEALAAPDEDGGVVEALMDMAAEEAQVLLVGDVGLASSR